MDARSVRIPRQNHMEYSSQSRKCCRIAIIDREEINKYYPETDETPKGHMNQQRKNVRSTKTPFEVCDAVAALRGKKMKDIFVSIYDTRKTSFSD